MRRRPDSLEIEFVGLSVLIGVIGAFLAVSRLLARMGLQAI
jgi:hypothetical protein